MTSHGRHEAPRTSKTGAWKAFSTLCSVAGARADEHERMKRSGTFFGPG